MVFVLLLVALLAHKICYTFRIKTTLNTTFSHLCSNWCTNLYVLVRGSSLESHPASVADLMKF